MQAMGILVQLEGAKFAKRVASLLPLLDSSLYKGVQSMGIDVVNEDGEDESAVTGWQEVYACLSLLERIAAVVPAQVCHLLNI